MAMDQAPQDVLRSIFSIDSSMTESRGHFYPYNYHYGHSSHPSTEHAGIPPASYEFLPQNENLLAGASQVLVTAHSNLSAYGVHGTRPPTGDAKQDSSNNTLNTQHGAEDLRSDSRTDMQHHRSMPSEQHYVVDQLCAISAQPCPSSEFRHMSNYSLQPTDLRTQPINVRVLNDVRTLSGDPRPPLNNSRPQEESRPLLNEEVLNTNRALESFRYPGDLHTYSVSNPSVTQEETQLPSGIQRPPVSESRPTENSRSSYVSSQVGPRDCRHSSDCHESNTLKPVTSQIYCDRSDLGTSKTSVCGEDLTTRTFSRDSQCDTGVQLITSDSSLVPNTGMHNTEMAEGLSYPVVSSSNTPLKLLSHSLEQHMEERDCQEGGESGRDQSDDKSLHVLNNITRGNGDNVIDDGEIHFEDDERLDEDGDDDDNFDSEASSTDFELSQESHEVFHSSLDLPSKPFHCQDCDATFTSKGYLKVHQRIHTGERPYSCKECGKKFSYCAAYQAHKMVHSGHRPFKCEFCQRGFFRSEHLERHRRRHTGERPFKCTECNATFAASDGLSRHTRTHTGERPYSCEQCGMSFTYKSTFLRHEQVHTEEIHNCDYCGAGFSDPKRLEKHAKKHNDPNYMPGSEHGRPKPNTLLTDGQEVTECEFCQMKFNCRSDYYRHRLTHTGKEPYTCDVCNSTFTRRKNLSVHMRIHTGEKPYKCDHCHLTFAQKSNKNAHLRIHTGDKPFKCDQCDAGFHHNNSLVIHKKTHTGAQPFVCDHCGANFAQKPYLNHHKQAHLGIKVNNCDECSASFTKDSLLAHKIKHAKGNAVNVKHAKGSKVKVKSLVRAAKVQGYKCSHCNMMFTHPSRLIMHTRKHTGERPFVCEECGASFLHNSNLTTHRKKHTGERPFKCSYCDSSFILKSYLTMHLRKHTGEKPFQCDICQARFTQKTHLSTHQRIHTGECPYKCEECGEAFRDGGNFWKHKKKHVVRKGITVKQAKGRRGHGHGGESSRMGQVKIRYSDQEPGRTVPTRRTARIPKLAVKFRDPCEPVSAWPEMMVMQDSQGQSSKEQKEDHSSREEKEFKEKDKEQPNISLNPEMEIKLENETVEIERVKEELPAWPEVMVKQELQDQPSGEQEEIKEREKEQLNIPINPIVEIKVENEIMVIEEEDPLLALMETQDGR